MPKLPQQRTISQLVERQLPAFVRDDNRKFVAFLKAYYEWLETSGKEIYSAKILSSTATTVTLPANASKLHNFYTGYSLVVKTGPAVGQTRKIVAYDETIRVIYLDAPFEEGNYPPYNSKVAVVDSCHPSKLIEYSDIDSTVDEFVEYFKRQFLHNIPGNILGDKATLLKNIKQFYRAKGTEKSFRLLFRLLFDSEVDFYYPKVDLLKTEDAHWVVDRVMRLTTTDDTFGWVSRQIVGEISGATAYVESVEQFRMGDIQVSQLYLSNIDGEFVTDETEALGEHVYIKYPKLWGKEDVPPETSLEDPMKILKTETVFRILSEIDILEPGLNYKVGDIITVSTNGGFPAKAIVTSVFTKYYTGRVVQPPEGFYLEPFWEQPGRGTTDDQLAAEAGTIPGMFFYADVRREILDSERIDSNELTLAFNEVDIDDYFVGNEITITTGRGSGQTRTILSYNGVTKVAVVDVPFSPTPDGTSTYSILHNRGGIKRAEVIDFGLAFNGTPVLSINTDNGNGAVLKPKLGGIGAFPGRWTDTGSFLDDTKVLQDDYYYQDFSYVLKLGETVDKFKDVVKTLLHPAGLQMFGGVQISTHVKAYDFRTAIKSYILWLDAGMFDLKLKEAHSQSLVITGKGATTVVGATNRTLDGFKFKVFPPNQGFTVHYPIPNNDYWKVDGPGNTQLGHFKDTVIGSILNFPDRRTLFAPDAFIAIDNGSSVTEVGPVTVSRRTLELAKFAFDTQLASFQNIPISDVLLHPERKKSNFCFDADITIPSTDLPILGNVAEYAFLTGPDPQILYNISPNSTGNGNASLGLNGMAASDDPVWNSYGLQFDGLGAYCNAPTVPVNLRSCSVVVVARCNDISKTQSIVNCLGSSANNGFSIDIGAGGSLMFRSHNNIAGTKAIQYPVGSILQNDWFICCLRFQDGVLKGQLNGLGAVVGSVFNYPVSPDLSSSGWKLGKPSMTISAEERNAALYGSSLYKQTRFRQAATVVPPQAVDYFTGYMSYAMFYDRGLYDFEWDAVRVRLTNLLADRSIVLP